MKGILKILLKCLVIAVIVLIIGLLLDNFTQIESFVKILLLGLSAGISAFCLELLKPTKKDKDKQE